MQRNINNTQYIDTIRQITHSLFHRYKVHPVRHKFAGGDRDFFLDLERDPRIVDHFRKKNLRSSHGASSHGKSLLAMIGKDLGWNLCHSFPSDNFTVPPRTDATTFSNSTPFFSANMNSSPSRGRITTNPSSSPRCLEEGGRKVIG